MNVVALWTLAVVIIFSITVSQNFVQPAKVKNSIKDGVTSDSNTIRSVRAKGEYMQRHFQ